MSASPAGGPPSGPTSTTPNGTGTTIQRKRPKANPFMVKKKPAQKKVEPAAKAGTNGTTAPSTGQPVQPTSTKPADPDDDPSRYSEYPLVATKKSILQNLRHHAMRLASEQEVNPYDPSQFTRPLRLHRRYPRDQKVEVPENGVDDKEREKEEIRKAERQAQKDANQAQIAPTGTAGQQQKKRPQFKKKVEDVYYPQDTPAAQKRAKLRYEEGRPWHLEDFDGKNTWVGAYEEPLSETHAMFVLDNNGSFRMVPLEKWYKFTPTGRYKTMDLDEAEKHMANKIKGSRWFLENTMTDEQRKRMAAERQAKMMKMKGRVGMRGERSGPRRGDDGDGEAPEVADDMDEIDFDAEDEFQDDDEGKLFGGDDEDIKESEKKIRQEMLGANIFAGTGVKEEKDWDEEEEKEKKKEAEERRRQRKLRRALVKNERKFEYESESDHPYSEESEDEEDLELVKDEDVKKEDDKGNKSNGDKPVSGASSVGTNTPSGRNEKHGDPRSIGSSLKRPGSPNLSEASGSESSRKRLKKEANGQFPRPMSPSIGGSVDGSRRRGAGSGSDTEASGNERSRPRIKVSGSRSGSPGVSAPSSRPVSPPPRPGSAAPPEGDMPSMEEVRGAIPPGGIPVSELSKMFRSRIPRGMNGAFIQIVKSVGRNSPDNKQLIIRK
ncbi:Transcription initiation factor IIF subunit alpha-like protein [Elsinoe fawcettii]|nr:Transcription initiation factor IIF subunit alpha-like protein [Elsinoe fawcettii]